MPVSKPSAGKKFRQSVVIVLFLFLPLLAFSQTNYKEGLVVTSRGDTLRGYINYREWNTSPEEFAFKQQLAEAQSRSFTPQTARYAAITGYEAYEAHRVSVSQDEVAVGRLKEGLDTTTITATVFLKLLLKGDRVNLYYYKDRLKERFYYLEKGAAVPVELGYKVYLVNTDIATYPVYRQQLAALAMRHQVFTLTQQIQSAEYTGSHLMRLLTRINTTTDTGIANTLEQAPKTRWFTSTGLNFVTFVYQGGNEIMIDRVSDSGFYIFKDRITSNSYLPRFSGGADLYLNPAVQHWMIRGELILAPARSEVQTQFQHKNYSTTDPPQEQLNVYRLSLLTISAAPQVLFNAYNTEKIKWYLGGGGAFNYRLVTQNKVHLQRTDQGAVIAEGEKVTFFDMRKTGLTLLLRSGLMLNKKMDLSVLYSPAVRINARPAHSREASTLHANSLQLSSAYFF